LVWSKLPVLIVTRSVATTKETLTFTANWTGWISFCIDNATLSGK